MDDSEQVLDEEEEEDAEEERSRLSSSLLAPLKQSKQHVVDARRKLEPFLLRVLVTSDEQFFEWNGRLHGFHLLIRKLQEHLTEIVTDDLQRGDLYLQALECSLGCRWSPLIRV